MATTLLLFSQANDGAAATTKKLQKQSIFADYFRCLEEADLRLAVRYSAGQPFAASDERVLNVGWRMMSDVIVSILKLDAAEYHELVVHNGDIGEALSVMWPIIEKRPDGSHELTLQEISSAFDEIAGCEGADARRAVLTDLFGRCVKPREAAYLAKIIFREMRSGAREGVLQASIAQAFGKSLAAIQRCQLLVGDLDEVAVLAKTDALDMARLRLFHPIQFMLASPRETPELVAEAIAGRTFWAEDKLDGIRAQVHKSGQRIAIYTRTMDRAEDSFPDIVAALAEIAGEFLLDGEIVPYRDGQVLPFAHIQRRLGRKVLSARILADNPAAFIAFDILYRDGTLLMDCPLKHRRQALEALASTSPLLITEQTAVRTSGEIAAVFDAARERRNEGIVLKDPDSLYAPGRRSQCVSAEAAEDHPGRSPGKSRLFSGWIKLKTFLPTLDCVVTAAEYGHGKRRSVLSDYTFAVWDRSPGEDGAALVNVGKAYSGLTDVEIAELTRFFLSITVAQHGRVHVVKPQVVLEIAFDQIQQSNRHASGFALRFPRIKRIRPDKRPADADCLGRVVELYESGSNFGKATQVETPEPSLFD